jgi:hypothetical protein
LAQTGPEPIAINVGDKFGLPVDQSQGALGATEDTVAAAVAEFLVYLNNVPNFGVF